jgi:hypothetical protein
MKPCPRDAVSSNGWFSEKLHTPLEAWIAEKNSCLVHVLQEPYARDSVFKILFFKKNPFLGCSEAFYQLEDC